MGKGIVSAGKGVMVFQSKSIEDYLKDIKEKIPGLIIYKEEINSKNFSPCGNDMMKDFFFFNPDEPVSLTEVEDTFFTDKAIPATSRDFFAFILQCDLPEGDFTIVAAGQQLRNEVFSKSPRLVFLKDGRKYLEADLRMAGRFFGKGEIFLGCRVSK